MKVQSSTCEAKLVNFVISTVWMRILSVLYTATVGFQLAGVLLSISVTTSTVGSLPVYLSTTKKTVEEVLKLWTQLIIISTWATQKWRMLHLETAWDHRSSLLITVSQTTRPCYSYDAVKQFDKPGFFLQTCSFVSGFFFVPCPLAEFW